MILVLCYTDELPFKPIEGIYDKAITPIQLKGLFCLLFNK
tara:strand:+ start:901 stop:1020 length:120 start_codon:yes stop_codon:yes gene_type:complete